MRHEHAEIVFASENVTVENLLVIGSEPSASLGSGEVDWHFNIFMNARRWQSAPTMHGRFNI